MATFELTFSPSCLFLCLLGVGKLGWLNSCCSPAFRGMVWAFFAQTCRVSLLGFFYVRLGLFGYLQLSFPARTSRSVLSPPAMLPPGKVQGNPGNETITAASELGVIASCWSFQSEWELLCPRSSAFCALAPVTLSFLLLPYRWPAFPPNGKHATSETWHALPVLALQETSGLPVRCFLASPQPPSAVEDPITFLCFFNKNKTSRLLWSRHLSVQQHSRLNFVLTNARLETP